jgi:hypothetical protein
MDETQQNQNYRSVLRRPVRQVVTEEEIKERISKVMGGMLIITALSIDAFQALLNILIIGEVFSTVISVCADTLFVVWFWMLGVSFTKSPKAFFSMAGQAVVGLIPVLNTLPELTLGIIGVVVFTRIVDKSNSLGKLSGLAQTKIK